LHEKTFGPKKSLGGSPKTVESLDFVQPRCMVVTPLDRSIIEREIDK